MAVKDKPKGIQEMNKETLLKITHAARTARTEEILQNLEENVFQMCEGAAKEGHYCLHVEIPTGDSRMVSDRLKGKTGDLDVQVYGNTTVRIQW